MDLHPVGIVHSPVADPGEMPFEGVPARLEIFPQFGDALAGMDAGTHILVLGWLHQSNQDTLGLAKTRWGNHPPRGVFGLRSSHRPNPLSLTTCRLERVDGLNVHVERLDLIDGTPLVDLKRYSPSWDCVFSARSSRDLTLPGDATRGAVLDGMMVEAANFHGERCLGVALGVRLMHHAMVEWQMAQKDPAVVAHMGDNGCIADAIQGLSGATLGNGRMKVPSGRAFRLAYDDRKVLAFQPRERPEGYGVDDVLAAEIGALFAIRSDVYAQGAGPHGGKAAKPPATPQKQAILLERVGQVMVEGRLPCAAAHMVAQELGVSLSDVGWAADTAKVRITRCQLGCFR